MDISLRRTYTASPKDAKARESYQWRIQGEGPDTPIRPDACLKLKFSHQHRQDHISLFNWLIFF